MTYPGGKNGSGVYQKIINQMPPHDVYIEPFVGGGAVLRLKRPASSSIVIDADAEVCKSWRRNSDLPGVTVIRGDAISSLHYLVAAKLQEGQKVLVYADPPYLGSTRADSRPIYRHEMMSDEDHLELLRVLKSLDCMVMVSGYWSELYERELKGWRSINFQAMTRGGFAATEWLWMNYPQPFELHDYQYLGEGYRERERIKRKKIRWRKRLESMDPLERYALLETVNTVRDGVAGSV